MIDQYDLPQKKFRSRKSFTNDMNKKKEAIGLEGRFKDSIIVIQEFTSNSSSCEIVWPALVGYGNLVHPSLYLGMVDVLSSAPTAVVDYRLAWMRHYLFFQLKYFYIIQAKWKKPELPTAASLGLSRLVSDIPVMLAIFGNRKLFENALNQVLEAFDKGMFANSITYITQLFMLQLAEAFMGYPSRDWKSYLDIDPLQAEPLFNELWQQWDTQDLSKLEPLLVQLLNRHTYKASRDNPDGGRDFYGHSEQFPLELFFIYRLREWKGLTNPAIKHRLTEPPFHELPEPLVEIEFDELTINFVREIRSVFPDMDQAITAMKTRDWHMLL